MNTENIKTKVNEIVGLLLELSDYIDTDKLLIVLSDILDCSYTGINCEMFNYNCNDDCKLIDDFLTDEFNNLKN
jgi:hypothetical protein